MSPEDNNCQENSTDYKSLLNTFPEEVWDSIVKKLKGATDYQSVRQASSYFQEQFRSHRSQILFSAILKILVEQNTTWETYIQDLATLRQVCRAWKNGVDLMNQSTLGAVNFTTVLKSVSDLEAFNNHFRDSHWIAQSNPFPARRVVLQIPDEHDQLAMFYAMWLKVLMDYGKHITQFFIHVNMAEYSDVPALLFYHQLQEMLQLMPNLHTIWFDIQPARRNISEDGIASLIVQFPRLPKLAFIEQGGMHLPLFLLLLQPNAESPRKLKIEIRNQDYFTDFLKLRLRSLETLSLDASSTYFDWPTLFFGLEKCCGETLTKLDIMLPEDALGLLDACLWYKLPYVKELSIEFKHLGSLDVLLGVRESLEKLTIKVLFYTKLGLDQVRKKERSVKFYRHFPHLQNSNIWKKFPKLETVAFEANFWHDGSKRWKSMHRFCKREDSAPKNSKCNII